MKKQIQAVAVLLLFLLSISCSAIAKPGRIAYVIPEGYTGGVLVLYDEQGVMPETDNDGTIFYEIPKDGLLRVKYTLKGGAYKYNFYYADKANNLTPIQYVHPQGAFIRPEEKSIDTLTEEEKNTKICAMNLRSTGFKVNGKEMLLYVFSIGLPKDGNSIYLKTLDKVDELDKKLSNQP